MKTKTISGKISWQSIGTGFWGIVDDKGGEWRPVNMPEQLKQEGKKVKVTLREVDETVSIFMWGVAVKIISFST